MTWWYVVGKQYPSTSDGQIQIIIRFKSRLNHLWRFDLSSKRFDLNVYDSIGIRFEIHGDSICKSAKSQNNNS